MLNLKTTTGHEVRVVTVFLLLCIVIVSNVASVTHKGFYTNGIQDGEVIRPIKIGSNGDVSHNLTTFHDEHEGPLLINITLSEENHLLVLNPVNNFFTRSIVVERHKRDIQSRNKLKLDSTKCHYHGSIKGHVNSKVAVSTCNGLAGMIHTKIGKYWIEPYHHHDKNVGPYHKHIIYKRSTATYQRDNKKRRKKQKRPRNCGTREHPRLTHLEWESRIGNGAVQEKKSKIRNRLQNKQRPKKPVGRKRSVRSVSFPRFVETLIVADYSMVEFHEDSDIETYLLTIMNMVSSLFQDPSIGNLIKIVVVKIILLEDPVTESAFNVTSKAEDLLKNFCTWQNSLNKHNDSDPYHHDAAVLITRKDLCSRPSMPCNTLGVAHIGGMCDGRKSCSVNEDSGMNLAHTIAHELGHNFGMYHDTEKVGCKGKEGHTGHVMTPSFESDSVGVVWSNCSRREITIFLDKGLGSCLEDDPQKKEEYQYPSLPAGAMYNANMQCKLQFGVEASLCVSPEEMCSRLWCEVNGLCVTRMQPAAPGTQCGKHKWCNNNSCVLIMEPPPPVDGEWGQWSSWSECSRTCGAGVSIMQRECDHPAPTPGGRFCVGERKRYRVCNRHPCPIDQPSFRTVQCASYNNKTVGGRLYKWHPFFDKDEPCALYCSDSNETITTSLAAHALDGTPCNLGKRDMCISGICKKVGCDWVVDSNATENECGVCHAGMSACGLVNAIFQGQSKDAGYKMIAILPRGARNIIIEEMEPTENYIAIKDSGGDHFRINGERHINVGGEYVIGDTHAVYEIDHGIEKVQIPGPLEKTIQLYIIFKGNVYNPGIQVGYIIPRRPIQGIMHAWILSDWSLCSVTCGGGMQIQTPLCQESQIGAIPSVIDGTAYTVEESACNASLRPQQRIRTCNERSCQTNWWVGPWQPCAVTCSRKLVKPMRERTIMCATPEEVALPDKYCANIKRPHEYELCKNLPLCIEE